MIGVEKDSHTETNVSMFRCSSLDSSEYEALTENQVCHGIPAQLECQIYVLALVQRNRRFEGRQSGLALWLAN